MAEILPGTPAYITDPGDATTLPAVTLHRVGIWDGEYYPLQCEPRSGWSPVFVTVDPPGGRYVAVCPVCFDADRNAAFQLGIAHAHADRPAYSMTGEYPTELGAIVGHPMPTALGAYHVPGDFWEAYDAGYFGTMAVTGRWHPITPIESGGRFRALVQATDGHATETDECDHDHATHAEAMTCAVQLAADLN